MVERHLHTPVYDLRRVKSLAGKKHVDWKGINAQIRCQQELNLSTEQVCNEIEYLALDDYVKTFYYDNNPTPNDGYKMNITDGYGRRVTAYLKVCIDDDRVVLIIGSFHGSFTWVHDE